MFNLQLLSIIIFWRPFIKRNFRRTDSLLPRKWRCPLLLPSSSEPCSTILSEATWTPALAPSTTSPSPRSKHFLETTQVRHQLEIDDYLFTRCSFLFQINPIEIELLNKRTKKYLAADSFLCRRMLSRAALTVPRRAAAKFVLATEIDGKLVKANMDWADVQATRVSGNDSLKMTRFRTNNF